MCPWHVTGGYLRVYLLTLLTSTLYPVSSTLITDLVLLVLRILRRDLSELVDLIELVDLYNEGWLSYVDNLVRIETRNVGI